MSIDIQKKVDEMIDNEIVNPTMEDTDKQVLDLAFKVGKKDVNALKSLFKLLKIDATSDYIKDLTSNTKENKNWWDRFSKQMSTAKSKSDVISILDDNSGS